MGNVCKCTQPKNKKIPYDITALRQKNRRNEFAALFRRRTRRGEEGLCIHKSPFSSPSPEIDGIENETTRKGSRGGGWAGQGREEGTSSNRVLSPSAGSLRKKEGSLLLMCKLAAIPGEETGGRNRNRKGGFSGTRILPTSAKHVSPSFPMSRIHLLKMNFALFFKKVG